jgi:DNA-binding MarR family transcriptional regulator
MEPYDTLIGILDAFIDNFDGRMRIRGIQTVFLIQQATLDGSGISASEVARRTAAPLENVRRHLHRAADAGRLTILSDPDDARSTRVFFTDPATQGAQDMAVAQRLAKLRDPSPDGGQADVNVAPSGSEPLTELIAVLQSFIDGYRGGLRMRAIKTALLIQKSTLQGSGISFSELARQSDVPAETMRRAMNRFIDLGILRCHEDPRDDRKNRVVTIDINAHSRTVAEIMQRLAVIDWRRFQPLDQSLPKS